MNLYGREEVAWFAGLYEGEGCVNRTKRYNKVKYTDEVRRTKDCITIKITSTDWDVLNQAQDVFTLGTLYGPYPRSSKDGKQWKPIYQLSVNDFEECQAIFAAIYPWLCKRRREQFEKVLYGGQREN